MRRTPPPLSVTLPPPSSTTTGLRSFRTFAVCVMTIVTGSGPQEKVMMPPAATAATTAADVQDAGVPVPTTRVGREVFTWAASAGTGTKALVAPLTARAAPAAGARAAVRRATTEAAQMRRSGVNTAAP
jgi:hypothetical protein